VSWLDNAMTASIKQEAKQAKQQVEEKSGKQSFMESAMSVGDGVLVPTSYEKGADWSALVKEGFVDDPLVKAKIFAEQRFPDLPPEESIKNYRVFAEDGEQVIAYTTGEKDSKGNLIYFREKPENIKSQMLNIASAIPSEGVKLGAEALGAAAAAARVAPNPVSKVLGSATGASLAGGATEAAFQAGQSLYGDDFDVLPVAERAKWAAYGELMGRSFEPILSKGFQWAFGKKDMPIDEDILNVDVDDMIAFSQERGITLTPAELTNARQLKQIQRVLKQDPITAAEMDEFLKLRTDKINEEAFNLINDSTGADSAAEGIELASKAVVNRYDKLVKERSDSVKDLYKEGAAKSLDIAPVKKIVDPLLNSAQKSGIKRNFINSWVDKFYEKTPDGKKYINTQAGNLHDIRQEIDRVLELDTTKGWQRRELSELRKSVDDALKTIPEYKKADKIFSDKSKPIDAIRDKFGAKNLSDINDVGDVIVKRVFSSPKKIAEAKKIFIDGGEKEAWDNLAGSWLMSRLENMPERTQGVNTAFDIKKALMGAKNKVQGKRMLDAAFDESQMKDINSFIDVMEAISRDGNLGSPTWVNDVVADSIKQMGATVPTEKAAEFMRGIGGLFKTLNIFEWGDKIEGAASDKLYQSNMKKLSNLFSNPDGLKNIANEMEAIKKYGAKSGQGKKALGSMIVKLYGQNENKEARESAADANKRISADMVAL